MKFIEHSNSVYKSNKKFISPKKKRIKRIILELSIFLFILSILLGILSEIIQSNNTISSLRKVHKLGGYGDYKIAYAVSGGGENIVLFESDIGETLLQWNPIVRESISGVKMIYYDRFGYGGSDKFKEKISVERQVDILNNLVTNTGYEGKHILVSEGYGSLIHMEYLKEYGDKVGGIILINPTIFRNNEVNIGRKILDKIKGSFFKLISTLNIPKLLDKMSKLNNSYINLYREKAVSRNLDNYINRMMSKDYYDVTYDEAISMNNYLSHLDLNSIGVYDIPVIVIDSESNKSDEYENILRSHFKNLEIIYFENTDNFTYTNSDYLRSLIININSRVLAQNNN